MIDKREIQIPEIKFSQPEVEKALRKLEMGDDVPFTVIGYDGEPNKEIIREFKQLRYESNTEFFNR